VSPSVRMRAVPVTDPPASRTRCHHGVVTIAAQAFEADRIVVIGCTGSGKSTLAALLAARLGAVHIRRDCLGPEGSDQYRNRAAAAVIGDRWVFDGAPYGTVALVQVGLPEPHSPEVLHQVRAIARAHRTRRGCDHGLAGRW
jgi:pantothenate kinase-related protein Tda10